MGIKNKALDFAAKSFLRVTQLNKATAFSCGFAELINPSRHISHKGQEYVFSCPNRLTKWRADTFFTKEPETIEWIDGFKAGDLMIDIGANVGLYSIYAAKRGVRVLAMEPESQNYAILNRNVFLNRCSDKVTCLNIAVSDKDSLDHLYIPTFQTGGALNCVGSPKDWNYRAFKEDFKQGIITYSLDSFVERYPDYFPSYIKIDVDGIEPSIIRGAAKTLSDKRVKSALIEINETLKDHREIEDFLRERGLSLLHKKHSAMLDGGPYAKCFNYIFTRR